MNLKRRVWFIQSKSLNNLKSKYFYNSSRLMVIFLGGMWPRCSWKAHHGDEPFILDTVLTELYKMAYVRFKTERNTWEPSFVRYRFNAGRYKSGVKIEKISGESLENTWDFSIPSFSFQISFITVINVHQGKNWNICIYFSLFAC
jgi:hypothetical protein